MSVDLVDAPVEPVLTASAMLTDDLDVVSDRDVIAALEQLETHRRYLAGLEHRLCAQIMDRHIGNVATRDNLAGLLSSTLRLSACDARQRATDALDLGPRTTLTGEPLPPLLPACAAAIADGAISTDHTRIIRTTLTNLDTRAGISADISGALETLLVDAARRQTPRQLQRTADYVEHRIDQDGTEPSDDPTDTDTRADTRIDDQRAVSLRRHHAGRHEGMTELRGWLTPETAAVYDTIFDCLAAPVPGPDGARDPRSHAQRCHDALTDTALRLLRSGTLPDTGGTPVTVLVRINHPDLPAHTPDRDAQSDHAAAEHAAACQTAASGAAGAGPTSRHSSGWGFGITAHGHLIRLHRLAKLGLTEADLIPAHLDRHGAVLDLGRTARLATCAQRRALTARDGGCCFPGCDRPATWCQVHHVIEWAAGGPTDLSNLCLLCPYHHRSFTAAGWTITMRDGLPEWTPPVWYDPDQQPVRNTTHHPPDITFRQPEPTPV